MNNMCFVAQLIRALCWNHESTCSDPAEEEATKIFRHVLNAGFLIGASCLRDLRFRYFIVNEEINRVPNGRMRPRTEVTDAEEQMACVNWSWFGHEDRRSQEKWTERMMEWPLREQAFRNRGRSPARWTDDVTGTGFMLTWTGRTGDY
uniref:Uncharacterized protein n=1 Tax=Dendroctonus ponderosae TaxID=77166 RepID=A0AAR5PP18_DENPD